MKKKENTAKTNTFVKGTYVFLIIAIIILFIILLYLSGIMFWPAFSQRTRQIPVLCDITNYLMQNNEEQTGVKKNSSQKENSNNPEDGSDDMNTNAGDDTGNDGNGSHYNTLLEQTNLIDESYLNHCIFLGDSRTVAMVTYGYLPEDSTLAKVGLCHVDAERITYQYKSGAQYSFSSYLQTHPAEVIYLSYGINGVGFTDEQIFKEKYETLLDDVMEQEPYSHIVIQSIWPVREGYVQTKNITNSHVESYNSYLYELAERKGVYYLDTASILKDESGAMKEEYNSGDGLHYNEEAYKVIMDYINNHPIPKMIEDPADE